MTTRYIGNCQICEGDQKLHDGRMVHHGYSRPGDGFIHGDCPGVSAPPYETSCDLLKTVKALAEQDLVAREGRLAKLKAGEVTHFTRGKDQYTTRGRVFVVEEYVAGVTEPYLFERELRSLTWECERGVEQTKAAIERFARRIESWKPAPVRTVEEEAAKARAGREERAKVAAERRAMRQAEAERKKRKRDELEARRQGIKDDFVRKLTVLAETPADPGSLAEAQKIASELRKKKYSFIWGLRDLKCEEACIRLGLARREPDGWVRYLE